MIPATRTKVSTITALPIVLGCTFGAFLAGSATAINPYLGPALVAFPATAALAVRLPVWAYIPVAVLLRTISNTGASTTGSSALLNLLSLAAYGLIICGLVKVAGRFSPSPIKLAGGFLIVILTFGSGVAVWVIGTPVSSLTATLPYWFYLGVGILAARLVTAELQQARVWSAVAFLPAAALVIAGAALENGLLAVDGRSAGTFSHPNSAGASLGVAVVLSSWLLVSARLRRERRLWALYTTLLFAALIATQSLTAIAATVVALCVLVFCSHNVSALKKCLLALLVLPAALLALASGQIGNRLVQLREAGGQSLRAYGGEKSSLEWRFENWRILYDIWGQRPVLGYGLGSTSTEIQPLGGPPHSIYVQALVELGLLGCLMLAISICIFVLAIRRYAPDTLSLTAAVGAFGAIDGATANFMGYTPAVIITCLVLGSSLSRQATGRSSEPESGTGTPKDRRSMPAPHVRLGG